MGKKKDGKPLLAVKVLVAALPLILRISLVFLKYKRAAKKREKVFRKTLKKEGLEKEVVEKLVEDLPELSVRDFISGSMKGKMSDRRWL